MLRRKHLAKLDELGLGHLADVEVTLYRYGEELHGSNPCGRYSSMHHPFGQEEPEDAETVVTTPRQVDEPVCDCARTSGNLPDLEDAERMLRNMNAFPRRPVPKGNTMLDLMKITQVIMAIEQTYDSRRWSGPLGRNPQIKAIDQKFEDEIVELAGELHDRLRAHGLEVSRLQANAWWLVLPESNSAGSAALRKEADRWTEQDLTGTWLSLVRRGHDREQRRRVMSKVVGGTYLTDMREYLDEDDDEFVERLTQVRRVLKAFELFEDELEVRMASTPALKLITIPMRTNVYESGQTRVAVEACTVAKTSEMRLLIAPADVLPLLETAGVLASANLPDDPKVVETASKLWEGEGESILSHPLTVIETAGML